MPKGAWRTDQAASVLPGIESGQRLPTEGLSRICRKFDHCGRTAADSSTASAPACVELRSISRNDWRPTAVASGTGEDRPAAQGVCVQWGRSGKCTLLPVFQV